MQAHQTLSLSVLILALNEGDNLQQLLPQLTSYLDNSSDDYEIIVVDGGSSDHTVEIASSFGCHVVKQSQPGYGQAFREGLAVCSRDFILTLDADMSHAPRYLEEMSSLTRSYDIIIASRYCPGGGYEMPRHRIVLSRILNSITRAVCGVSVADSSSGYRIYRAELLKGLALYARHFDILIEVLVKAQRRGAKVIEVPFRYYNRKSGVSKARILSFGVSYFQTLRHLMRRLRPHTRA